MGAVLCALTLLSNEKIFYKESLVAMEAVSKVLCQNMCFLLIKKKKEVTHFWQKDDNPERNKRSLKGWRIKKSGNSMLLIRKRQSVTKGRGDRQETKSLHFKNSFHFLLVVYLQNQNELHEEEKATPALTAGISDLCKPNTN